MKLVNTSKKFLARVRGKRVQGLVFDTTDDARSKTARIGESTLTVGRFTYGYKGIEAQQWNEGANVTIGAFCSIALGLKLILGGNHRSDWVTTFPFGHVFQKDLGDHDIIGNPYANGDITISNDVWIGQNVTVMSGVTIGDGAIVAANATVVKDIGAYEVWGGNPATLIKKRFDAETIDVLTELQWWTLPVAKIRELAPLLSQVPDQNLLEQLRKIAVR